MMNTEPTSLFDLAPKRLQWLATRQKVVSENIANADVSGYLAKDTQSFASYLADASGRDSLLEEQMMEANANSGQFKIAANLYRKAHEMLYAVAGRR
jgi:flagellar basal-body rod protein FlgB